MEDDNNYTIQSIIFEKKYFNITEAKKWLLKHNYKIIFYGKKPDITEYHYRFRQQSPKNYSIYKTKEITKGIKFVLGY